MQGLHDGIFSLLGGDFLCCPNTDKDVMKESTGRMRGGWGAIHSNSKVISPQSGTAVEKKGPVIPTHSSKIPTTLGSSSAPLTLSELQSRFGDKSLKFQVFCVQLSSKRDCGPKRVKGLRQSKISRSKMRYSCVTPSLCGRTTPLWW